MTPNLWKLWSHGNYHRWNCHPSLSSRFALVYGIRTCFERSWLGRAASSICVLDSNQSPSRERSIRMNTKKSAKRTKRVKPSMSQNKTDYPQMETAYQFYQRCQAYLYSFLECYNEKVGCHPSESFSHHSLLSQMILINNLEDRWLQLHKQRTDTIVTRRQEDVKDQCMEYSTGRVRWGEGMTRRRSMPSESHGHDQWNVDHEWFSSTARSETPTTSNGTRSPTVWPVNTLALLAAVRVSLSVLLVRLRRRKDREQTLIQHFDGMSTDDEESQSEINSFVTQKRKRETTAHPYIFTHCISCRGDSERSCTRSRRRVWWIRSMQKYQDHIWTVEISTERNIHRCLHWNLLAESLLANHTERDDRLAAVRGNENA